MDKNAKIYIAGHTGLVGSAIWRYLERAGFYNLVGKTHGEVDLRDAQAVKHFFDSEKPVYVFLAAGRVGGIQANIAQPASFLYDNVMMQVNVIHQAYLSNVKKIVVLGSSCIYPKACPQPMKEDYLLDGKLEPTNEGYALSKIVALKMAEVYKQQYKFDAIAIMPPNLYGFNDSFDPIHSHVLSATVKKIVDAVDQGLSQVTMWGTGNARREFMHVDDMAAAAFYMMEQYHGDTFINVGWGEDISIKSLAELVADMVGYKGSIVWDTSKPDGMMRKCMDVTRMKEIGFYPKIEIKEGIREMINYYNTIKQ